MSDKTDKNPDDQLDQQPEDPDQVLLDVDALLAQEDPEFYSKVKEINIDADQVSSIDLDGGTFNIESQSRKLTYYLKRSIEIRANPKSVLSFWLIVFVALALLTFAWINKKNILHQDLFLTSFENISNQKVNDFNPITETEAFYDNPRFAKNLISMTPFHLNVKPSENSGDNPMLAMEITVEGLSADAIIEIKDRQAEFKDLLARHTETKTYDDLITADGKRQLCDQLRDLLNAQLTRGQVRRVLLKTFITKP